MAVAVYLDPELFVFCVLLVDCRDAICVTTLRFCIILINFDGCRTPEHAEMSWVLLTGFVAVTDRLLPMTCCSSSSTVFDARITRVSW